MKIQCIPMKSGWSCVRLSEEDSAERTPVHLCCVIDTSGSMTEQNKMLYVKQSLQFFLDSLTTDDMMSIITFDVEVDTLVQRFMCDAESKAEIGRRIQTIQAHGGTNLCNGLLQAIHTLTPFTAGRKQGILLLTDGEATHGHVNTHAILDQISGMFETFSGTSVSCIGYGTNHNVELLRRMSEKYAGSYYVVQQASDVPIVFGDIMGGLLSTQSQRIHLQVDHAEDVRSAYPVSRAGNHRDIYVGDLPAGKEAVVMIRNRDATQLTVQYDPFRTNTVHVPIVAAAASTDDEKMMAEIHSIRYEVIGLMNSVLSQDQLTNDVKNTHVEQIDALKARIQGLKPLFANPLWDLMTTELDHLRTYITDPSRCCVDFKQVLIQRNGCLAMLRGVGASASNQFHFATPPALRLTPAMSQGYSNVRQQTCSLNYTQSFQAGEHPVPLPSLGPSPSFAPGAPPMPVALGPSPSLPAVFFPNSQPMDMDMENEQEQEQDQETQPGAI